MRWEVKPLGAVCDVSSGSTPKRNQKDFWVGGDIPWFTVKDIREQGREIRWTQESVTQKALDETSLNVVPEGSVLLCCTASVGEYALTRIPTTFNQQFSGLTPTEDVAPRFLMFWCSTLKKELLSLSGKATVDFVSQTKLKNIVIPIPPLEEQERIVEVLDEAFAAIDKAKANIERNLTNARELFQSRLNDIFSNPLEDWEVKPLNELGRVHSGGTPSRGKSTFWNDGTIEWYSSRELNQEWTLPSKEKITIEGLENSNAKLFLAGSLLIGIYDTAAMKMSILTEESAFNQAIVGVDFDENIDVRFMRFQLMSMSDEIRSQRRGTRQQNLSLKKIKDVSVFVPELAVQKEVLSELLQTEGWINGLISCYQTELDNLEELRQSILEHAFEGRLTEPVAA
mgnify:CR=1 FL=1